MNKVFLFISCLASIAFGHYAVIGRPLQELSLDRLKNDLRVEEAQFQEKMFPSALSAEKAVALALRSFLNDGSHIESPLALAKLVAKDDLISSAKKLLFSHLNQYSSEITFVRLGEKPEHGEEVDSYWIIRLKIPSLSDHIFWAIIPRDGQSSPYNYGFN